MRTVAVNFSSYDISCSITIDQTPLGMYSELSGNLNDDFLVWGDQFLELLDQVVRQPYQLYVSGMKLHHILIEYTKEQSQYCQEIVFEQALPKIPLSVSVEECERLAQKYFPDWNTPIHQTLRCVCPDSQWLSNHYPSFVLSGEEANVYVLPDAETYVSGGEIVIIPSQERTFCQYHRRKTHLYVKQEHMDAVEEYMNVYYACIPTVKNVIGRLRQVRLDSDDETVINAIRSDAPQVLYPVLPAELECGESYLCKVRVLPQACQIEGIMIGTDDPAVVSLEYDMLCAHQAGTAEVLFYGADGSIQHRHTLMVSSHVWAEKIVLRPRFTKLHPVEDGTVDIQVFPPNAEDISEFSYQVVPPIAEWKAKQGVLSAYEKGSCELRIQGRKAQAALPITIAPALKRISISPDKISMRLKQETTFHCKFDPPDAAVSQIEWVCDMDPVCQIRPDGIRCKVVYTLPMETAGNAAITCVAEQAKASAAIQLQPVTRQKGMGCICPFLTVIAFFCFALSYMNIPLYLSLIFSIIGQRREEYGSKVYRNCLIVDGLIILITLLLAIFI